jgi:HSP20 family molecular chaperone IbpA
MVEQSPIEKTDKKATYASIENSSESKNDIFKQEGELVVDVFETHSDFVVLSAIAGVSIKDLDIAVEKGMMVIKGQRTDPHHNPEKKYFYQEKYH